LRLAAREASKTATEAIAPRIHHRRCNCEPFGRKDYGVFEFRASYRPLFLNAFLGLAKFGLELHPEKTRLIEFGRFAAHKRKQWGKGKPETFTFLGFTHYCGRRHKTDTFTVWRITSNQRMVAKLKIIKVELLRRKHDRISQVGAWLRKVVTGYYQYHAVPGNIGQLRTFRQRINRLWRNVLVRRSQRAKKKWESLTPVFDRWIPIPRILHPYPQARFHATHPS